MAEGQGVAATGAAATALEALKRKLGTEIHASDWMVVAQERVNAFAAATDDPQWIHTDPERAKRESPYKGTIAHGYLTLSLHPFLRGLVAEGVEFLPGVKTVINYGLNKVRFPNAVLVGSRIRGRFTLVGVEAVAPNVLQLTESYAVEIEGQPKPGCIAEGIMRLIF